MDVKSAVFVTSSTDYKKCPQPDKPEYAFIGRSNVGKSSLINMLTNRLKLAKVSSQPGKTQTINHFLINNQWYLVDLPGYGYAKTGKKMRETWASFINGYILNRENLYCLFILIDSRHEPLAIDMEFITWAGTNQVPLALVFTKSDKLSARQLEEKITIYQERLLEVWEELPPIFVTSSEKVQGRDEILEFIAEANRAE